MVNRLKEIRIKLQMTQQTMAKYLGIGKSALSMIETGKAALSERNKNILVQNLNLNPQWLDTGEGEMFLDNKDSSLLSAWCRENSAATPLYNVDAHFSLSALLKRNNKLEPMDYVVVPNLTHCDGAIYMMGDSMYPRLNAGDIIIYKKLRSAEEIFWGEMYLVSIEVKNQEYSMVKVITKSDKAGYVNLVSENKTYDNKEVEIKKIKALAMIKASIKLR